IRSKGVGVYFVTQNPLDVPDVVLGQLGNRAQHALRAFTPRDQKAVQAAAGTFRQNPKFDTAQAITQLAVGEALVSMLEDKGTPAIVSRTLVAPPASRVGPITPDERQATIKASPLLGKYDTAVDRESAFEVLQARAQGHGAAAGAPPVAGQQPGQADAGGGLLGSIGGALGGLFSGTPSTGGRQRMSTGELVVRSAVQSAARSAGTQIARAVLRGILGGMSR
ncbi:MAG TPA: helicase HerA-like domain-containing protein, partial [Beijerinckiaceae bacterium]|nr:helicase HerA-like domain-containing protein [Beijerinckiaceae bacterium]